MRVEGASAMDLPYNFCNFPYRSRITPVRATIVIVPSPIFVSLHIYRPQQSWGKVIFSVACVKNSVHGGSTWAGTPPPQAGTPSPGQVHPPPGRYTPKAGTPPGQVHPLGRYTPPGRYTPRAKCYEIRSMSGRYASYWNAFLFITCKQKNLFWTNFDYNRSRFLLAHELPLTKKKRCTKYFAWELASALVAFYNNMVIYDLFHAYIAHVRSNNYHMTIPYSSHCAWFIKHWKLSLHDQHFQARLIEIDTCECGSQLPILSLYEAHGKSRLRTELRGLHTSFLTVR